MDHSLAISLTCHCLPTCTTQAALTLSIGNFKGNAGSLLRPRRSAARPTLLQHRDGVWLATPDFRTALGTRALGSADPRGTGSNGQAHVEEKPASTTSQSQEKPSSEVETDSGDGNNTKLLATLSVAGGIVLLIVGGVLLKDQIKAFLDLFINLVDDWGPLGYLAYIVVYATLELLAVPAIPLTMTAGVIFGIGAGTAVVSVAATLAATGAFLIARYVARDRIASFASKNPRWAAIDRAIGQDGFRVVALLRLSPLLPLAASNYLYGLTSVDLGSYVAASWAGMLPGTLAYVAAGTYGRDVFLGAANGGHGPLLQPWQIVLGIGASGLAVWYVGRVATKALAELEDIPTDE